MNTLTKSVVGMLFAGVAVQAFAGCGANEMVFACTTTKGKVVQVCDATKTLTYAYGKPGQTPELALSVPRKAASTYQWPGAGRWMSYSVSIPNGSTEYRVFWGMDRLDEDHAIEAGIVVSMRGREVASFACSPHHAIVQNIEGIDLRPSDE